MHKESSLERLRNERENTDFVYLAHVLNNDVPSLTTVKSIYRCQY